MPIEQSTPCPAARAATLMLALTCVAALALGSGCRDDRLELEKLDPRRGLDSVAISASAYRFQTGPEGQFPKEWANTLNPSPWSIEQGKLVGTQVRHRALWLREPLPEYVRIDFEAQVEAGASIRMEIFGDGEHHESGYVLAFGAYDNPSVHFIGRLDEHGDDRVITSKGPELKPGQRYAMTLIRTDQALRWFVNDTLLLQFIDPEPLKGVTHQYFAFDGWDSKVIFDKVTVFTVKPTER
ncbi:MAG: hypothetical protein AAFX99_11455 [Myxococcota bacterium]